ncbi:MAG: hypothetical protein ACT4QF_09015 [Sporichthyaceae bacterium]
MGDSVWAYASGDRAETLLGTAIGGALVRDPWKDGPVPNSSWIAKRPGTSRVTLVIEADGERIGLGTFTVVVR